MLDWRQHLVLGTILLLWNSGSLVKCETCSFMRDMTSPEMKLALNGRCLKILREKYVNIAGQRGVTIHDRLCGVRDATTPEEIETAEVCYSNYDERIQTSFLHTIRLEAEVFFVDYTDVRKKRFKSKRALLEDTWNTFLLTNGSAQFVTQWTLERVVIIKMESGVYTELTNNTRGVLLTGLIQFSEAGPSFEDYRTVWNTLTNMVDKRGRLDKFKIDEQYVDVKYNETDVLPGCSLSKSMRDRIVKNDDHLWYNSKPNLTEAMENNDLIPIGSTVDFVCPDELQLSDDEDGFFDDDNTYSLLCTVTGRFQEPSTWPTCNPPCDKDLPDPDDRAKDMLDKIEPKTRIPSGKYGTYVCKRENFTVYQTTSEFFEVLCTENKTYNVPDDGNWPICMERRPIISPVLPIAIKSMLEEKDRDLLYRLEVTQHDQEVVHEENNNLFEVALPAILSLAFFIFATCCVTRNDSPIYRICKEESKDSDSEDDDDDDIEKEKMKQSGEKEKDDN